MNFLSDLKKSILNIPGWHTKRKIVVIESDDWGSIRMPSRKAFEKLTKSGLDLTSGDSLRYNTNDTLAGIDDLSSLFDILRRYKDQHGNHPVFTALSLVANPDFEKIRKYDFQQYYYEPITATLQRYYPNENVFQYWQQGIKERLFIPQFHGREHLNVKIWMNGLRDGDQQANAAFNEGMWGYNNKHPYHISLQAAFDPETKDDIKSHGQILVDGIKLFQEMFGYRPTFFVPPNGILHESLYEVVKLVGINYVFSSRLHRVPIGNGKFKTRFNYLGKRNNASQRFIIRNAFFEPSQGGKDWPSACLNDIKDAFQWNKPAIISTHRVNFIGAINAKNREAGLRDLNELLAKIVKTWPDAEFLSSDQLGDYMNRTHHEI